MANIRRIQVELRAEVAGMKPSSKDTKSTQRLLDVLSADDQARANRVVGDRLKRLAKRKRLNLDSRQQRDLLLIVIVGYGKVSNNMRWEAAALAKLYATPASAARIHEAFPALSLALNAKLK